MLRPSLALACLLSAGCDRVFGLEPGTCWAAWQDGSIALSAPARLDELADGGQLRNASISGDGRTLYYGREVAGRGLDNHAATRAEVGAPWRPEGPVAELNSAQHDRRMSTSADGTVAVVSSERDGATILNLWYATRVDPRGPFSAPSKDLIGMANTPEDDHGAELSADGLSLYFAPYSPSGQSIQVATRTSRDAPFGRPAPVVIDDGASFSANPAVSPDELVMVFVSGQGDNQLYYAVRATRVAPFGAPVQVPGVNVAGVFDGESEISSDGCEVYFTSERGGGGVRELYVATASAE